MMCSLLSQ